jgi:hypothetical protein
VNVTIGFTTSDWWVSRVIRWFTRSRVSHAALLLRGTDLGDLVLEASAAGFRLSTVEALTRGTTRLVAEVTPASPVDGVLPQVLRWLGEKYNYAGLFGESWVSLWRRFGKRARNPLRNSTSMFCSEACVYALQLAKYPGADGLDPQSTSPEDLLEFLDSTGSTRALT